MATYASIKYDMDLSSNATGAGGMTLLSTQTASSDSTISFTSGIDSTYKEYVFRFYDIHPSTDVKSLAFQVDTGTNTNYNQTITSTVFFAQHAEDDTTTTLEYSTGRDHAQASSFQTLTIDAGNANDESVAGYLHLYDPSNTTFVKHFYSVSSSPTNGTHNSTMYTAGYFNTTTALTRVQFKMDGGNIDSGTIKMYGVV
jgi:hypothetical protein